MGASTSKQQGGGGSTKVEEAESVAASMGALPILKSAFSNLSDPATATVPLHALRKCFSLNHTQNADDASSMLVRFADQLLHLGPAIVDLFFFSDKEGVQWLSFLKGYIECCGRTSSSMSFVNICRLCAEVSNKAGTPLNLNFEAYDNDTKISGAFLVKDVLMLLWMCWLMSIDVNIRQFSNETKNLVLPNFNNLLLSIIETCTDDALSSEADTSLLNYSIPAQRLYMWVCSTIPGLTHCFSSYVHHRLQTIINLEENASQASWLAGEIHLEEEAQIGTLMTSGRGWTISLTLSGSMSDTLLRVCCQGTEELSCDNLLYRSSLHGKGMNRFWSSVEGYHGPIFLMISACSIDSQKVEENSEKWVIGYLGGQGFENKNDYYGNSGILYAIDPVFRVFSPSGRGKNFIYSHLHSATKMYEAHPMPVGIAFGGNIGNERVFIDEDFAKLTIHHHAVDKTYQHGPLAPNQGYLPLEARILGVEAWGLGGIRAQEKQDAYKKRETLFSEQRRKVDLKSFMNWEDSPEKIMMDMMGDPNKVKREDR